MPPYLRSISRWKTLPKDIVNGNDVLRVPSLGAVRFCLYPAAAPETAAPILPPDTTLTSLVRQPSPHLADVQSQKEIGHEAHHGRFCSLYRNEPTRASSNSSGFVLFIAPKGASVRSVAEDGQAHDLGVEAGWRILSVTRSGKPMETVSTVSE